MKNGVPFLALGDQIKELRSEIEEAMSRVLDSGWLLLGPELEAFEKEWAAYVGAEYAVGVASGLDALHLSLRALGIGHGDEVIVPSNTYIATWLAVSQCGAIPVPVEPDINVYNIDPDKIAAAITERTKAIMPVHLYGHAADMDPLLQLANKHNLRIVEDAAQAHGAEYKGKRIGCHGDAVAWSFYPTKNLGALGDAGAITTNNKELSQSLKQYRNYGSARRYVCDVKGYNSRLEELHAAVLRVKLRHLDQWNANRRHVSQEYLQAFADLPIVLPIESNWTKHVYHLFVIRSQARDALQEHLAEQGVGTIVHYPVPPSEQAAYRELGYSDSDLPIASRIHREVISLPAGPHMSPDQVQRVIAAVCNFDGFAESGL